MPTLLLHGGADTCNHPDTSAGKERWFTGPYQRLVLPGLGRFPQREAPGSVAQQVIDFIAQY